MVLLDLFKRKPAPRLTELTVTGTGSSISAWNGDAYANDVLRSGVDAIARLAAKFVLQPVAAFSDGTTANCDEHLSYLLQVRPNRYQSAFDLLYQLVTHLFVHNNAYCYLQRDARGQVVALYPLHVAQCRHFEDANGALFSAFTFSNGRSTVLAYADVIHLRRHLNSRDVDGDAPAIGAAVSLADAQNRGIESSIRTAGRVRGVVSFSGALGPSKLDQLKREFEEKYLNPESAGGVVASDATFSYTPLEVRELPPITSEDQRVVRDKIYNYLGISEAIVGATFDDDVFAAFEESVIEPLALQIALEASAKIYGDHLNRRIECRTNRIRFIGTKNRNELLKNVLPMGALSINEARDLMGLPPLPEDRTIQSLNYASVELVDKYQLFKSGNGVKALQGGDDE